MENGKQSKVDAPKVALCCGIFIKMICFYENIQSQLSAYADNHQIYISSEKIDNVTNSLEEDGIQLVAMKTFNLN